MRNLWSVLVLAVWVCACSGSAPSVECLLDQECDGLVSLPNDCQRAECREGMCRAVALFAGESCTSALPPGPCQSASCDGEGACRVADLVDGTPCDEGDLCTLGDSCQAGVCTAGDPIDCPGPSTCRLQSVCQSDSGECSRIDEPDGTACDDGDPLTHSDACLGGVCGGLSDVDCPVPLACDLLPPDPGPEQGWRHTSSSIYALGTDYHRGRDLMIVEGDEQWAMGKFAYGLVADKDIHDEDVDIYLLRDCQSWEYLGRATTSDDGQYPTVHGVEDSGGRVYFPIPLDKQLAIGRHRIHFVVLGDLSTADQYIQVLPADARLVVTDIDGTLTSSEYAQVWDELLDISPAAHPGAPEALWALARKGHFIFYLTARPEFLGQRTQTWLAERGFPPGISHTTLTHTGETGDSAIVFKLAEIDDMALRLGRGPSFGFGNKESDAEAFMQAGMDPDRCYYYELEGNPLGGHVHSDYQVLADEFSALPSRCSE
jgi:hypothetical protein